MSRRASIAAAVVGGLLLALGGTALYADREIVDGDAFSVRATAALEHEPVREVVAEEVVGALVEQGSPDLLAVRPLLITAVEALIATPPFRRLFRLAVVDAHGVLFGTQRSSVILDLDRAGALLLRALRSVSPEVAEEIPADLQPRLAELDERAFEADSGRVLRDVAGWGAPATLLAVLLLIGSVALSPDRRGGLGRAGLATTGAAATVWLAVTAGGIGVSRRGSELGTLSEARVQTALAEVWASLFGDLGSWAIAVGAVGLAAAATGSRAVAPASLLADGGRRLRHALAAPAPAARFLRGLAAIVLGLLLVLRPQLALQVAVIFTGATLVFLGVGELAAALEHRRRVERTPRRRAALQLASVLAGAAAVAGLALAVALPTATPADDLPSPPDGCNGALTLCEHRLNEVVFPMTHNSFSAAEEPGWLFANQRYGLERQLQDGIRGFMLDPHWGVLQRDGRVRTDLDLEDRDRNRVVRELNPQAVAVADRLAGGVGLGHVSGRAGVFLCHTLCELGDEPMVAQLKILRDFLQRNPGEVVTLLLEPYVPAQEVERALRDGGLLDHVARLRRDQPLPTLGELVAADRRVVVLTEREGGARPWYLPAFSFIQDTPLGARAPGQLSCARNRGEERSPLLMLNHWIDRFPPPPSTNASIGRREVLLRRAERCAAARGLVPNLIAVDFYDAGDVVAVAEELNRRLVQRDPLQSPADAVAG